MFNQQLMEALARKYGQAKALMPMIPGAGATNAIAGTLLDKIVPAVAGEVGADADKPAGVNYGLPPETPPPAPQPAAPPVMPKPAMPGLSQPPAAPALPSMPAALPQPAPAPVDPMAQMGKYDDAARQKLYADIQARQQRGGMFQALGNVADTISRAGGSTPTDYAANIQKQTTAGTKLSADQFEAGREAKLQDISTGLALKKAGREETEYGDQNNPQSQMSKLAVGFAAKMLGPDKIRQLGFDTGKATYADVAKILPIVEKYVVAEQTKAEKDKKAGESLYQKKIQQLESVRGDQPLKNTEVQRDAAATAYRSLAAVKAKTGSYSQNPVDYIDTLGQLYKARTGQAPTDTVFKHLIQDWTGGKIASVATFLTGQQLSTSSNDVGGSILEMVNRMGDQADLQHEGYMKTRVDDRGLSPEDADAFHKLAKRGYSYAEQRQMVDDMLKNGSSTAVPQSAAPKELGGGWTVTRKS